MNRIAAYSGWTLSAWAALAIFGIFFLTNSASAEPFIPHDGAQVLEHLRASPSDSGARELRELRAQLSADANNLALASQYARRCIERSRKEADPRYLGRAQAALAPWWSKTNAPAEALVLRATIRQSQHDFTNALVDLDLALKEAPSNTQAWLTRATILTVLGEYPAARRACFPLAQLAPGLLALTAAANVSSLDGEAERGCALLQKALDSSLNGETSEQLWALTVLAEASARLGHETESEDYFKRALALDPRDSYLQCAYADLLLDQGRAREIAMLLKDSQSSDGSLLRLALAESQIKPKLATLDVHIAALAARFDAGHLRRDFVHQREEARFAQHLLGAPREALSLAQDNWRVQREPADARIFLESALAAKDPLAAQSVLKFLRNNRLQDVRLTQLANALDQQRKEP